jgi:hypothetical protein
MCAHIAILPDFEPVISQRRVEMVCGEQDAIVSFITFSVNQTKAHWPK